ncbi:hypothetical protein ACFSKT_02155 [Paenibacillus xanthanilyticus]|uniref:hypothetical protein n=1 Tax=Paenibacillus xanthanilyticus TaxID=1783531 RepID=UPI003644CFCC
MMTTTSPPVFFPPDAPASPDGSAAGASFSPPLSAAWFDDSGAACVSFAALPVSLLPPQAAANSMIAIKVNMTNRCLAVYGFFNLHSSALVG